jgi:hypothetical protein
MAKSPSAAINHSSAKARSVAPSRALGMLVTKE